jgi:hypothetical protein
LQVQSNILHDYTIGTKTRHLQQNKRVQLFGPRNFGLKRRICAEPPGAARVLAVMSPYSTPGERDQLSDLLDRSYEKAAVLQADAGETVDYRRR